MTNRTKTYVAFYVDESQKSNFNNNVALCPDMNYFNLMKAWKQNPSHAFSFADPHDHKPVGDEESRKKLFKVLHERLDISKHIILLLSKYTKESPALKEEITYGIDTCDLPVIIVYVDLKNVTEKDSDSKPQWTAERKKRLSQLPSLESRINSGKVTTMNIAGFSQEPILNAMKKYNINGTNDKKPYI